MQQEVLGSEGRRDTAVDRPHRVALVGNRDYGQPFDRFGNTRPRSSFEPETDQANKAVLRLIGRWVIGKDGNWDKKDRNLAAGPGLHVVSGGARGADSLCERIVRMHADGLRRRTRAEFADLPLDIEGAEGSTLLAEGLALSVIYADWQADGLAAGGIRNQYMVGIGLDEALAFYAVGSFCNPDAKGGTNDMVRRCINAGVRVHAYEASRRAWRTL